jgi:uncharacterized membrane protein
MRGIGGCLLVVAGFLGFFIAITLSLTFYLLPLAFLLFLGSLIMISFGIGPAGQGTRGDDKPKKGGDEDESSSEEK